MNPGQYFGSEYQAMGCVPKEAEWNCSGYVVNTQEGIKRYEKTTTTGNTAEGSTFW